MPIAAAAVTWLLTERHELQQRLDDLTNGRVITGERLVSASDWTDTTERSIAELRGRLAAIEAMLPKAGEGI